jgi:protein-disulfide isomerase
MGLSVRVCFIFLTFFTFATTQAQPKSASQCDKAVTKHHQSPQEVIQFAYGNPKAKIHVVEYSSMACGACSFFKKEVWPKIKKNFIKTGQVYWVVKPYVFSKADLVAAQLSHCSSTNLLFEQFYLQQQKWLTADDPEKEAQKMALKYGLNKDQVRKCLKNETIENGLIMCRMQAGRQLIEATPTFIIGNTKISQAIEYEEFIHTMKQAKAYLNGRRSLKNFFIKIADAEKLVNTPKNKKKNTFIKPKAHVGSQTKNQSRSAKVQ